ncbi:MAG: methyl-accepting chemotaxis protein [Vicinamibacterales bacterium]
MSARLTFGARIRAGVITLVVLIALIAAGAAWTTALIDGRQRDTLTAAVRMQSASRLQAINAQLQTAEKALILAGSTGHQEDLERWHATVREDLAAANAELDRLAPLVTTADERADVEALRDGVKAWSEGCAACHAETADLSDTATMARLSDETRELTARNHERAGRLEARQVATFEAQAAGATTATREARWALGVALIVALALGLLILATTARATAQLRNTAARLRQGASALLGVADTAATTSRRLAEASEGELASLDQAAQSMGAMAEGGRATATRLEDATGLLGDTTAQVERSNQDLRGLEASMQGIADASNRVTGILKRIDDLAFQTNLLALNAAVEAARVGEAGAGFAVVADEVRNLAQRSADAARDTGALIDQSLETSADGRERTDALGASMAAVTGSVAAIHAIVVAVAEASRAQRAEADQVMAIMGQLQEATSRTAAMATDTRTASDALQGQASAVTAIVETLEDLVGHGTSRPGEAAPPARQRRLRNAA